MATEPKPGSPTYYWLNPIQELQALNSPPDPRNQEIEALLLGQVNNTLLDVATFCVAAQPPAVAPAIADYESGAYVGMMADYAAASVFYNLCQEVPDAMLQTSFTLTAAMLLAGGQHAMGIALAGNYPHVFDAFVEYVPGSTAFNVSQNVKITDANSNDLVDVAGLGMNALVKKVACEGWMNGMDFLNESGLAGSDLYCGLNGPVTTGNGELIVTVFYAMVPLT